MNEIERVVEVALREIGYLEKKSNSQLDDKTANSGNGNYTKYARDLDNVSGFYNTPKNGYSWCDIFVDWCFVEAFGVTRALELLCQPLKSCGAGVGYSAQYYKQKGQFHTSNPKAGDQIFYKGYNHTGLVFKVDDNYIYTVEGNTSNPVNCVKEKKYPLNSKDIIGYGRPKYENNANTSEEPENDTEEPKTTFKVGDKVVPTKLVDYNGTHLIQYDKVYTISELVGNRAVLKARGQIWCAIHTDNIKLAE